MPVFHECQRCTACCRWPGQVRLDAGAIARIAGHLELSDYGFIQEFTRLADDRHRFVLQDQPDGACLFLVGTNRRVQPIKPQQCRDFPNGWNFPGFEAHCRAIPRDVSAEEWRSLVSQATGRANPNLPEGPTFPKPA